MGKANFKHGNSIRVGGHFCVGDGFDSNVNCLQSYAYMDDFASQFYSGPRLAFEDPEEDKRT